jgi:hypothetical protein
MYRQLHDELSHATEALRQRDRLRAQREALTARFQSERELHIELSTRLHAERKDVARLEGISFQRLFATLGGTLDEGLEKERQEAHLAELRFVEQDQLLAALQTEVDAIDRRIDALGDVDERQRLALDAKGRMLVERGDAHGRLVLELSGRVSEIDTVGRELDEAIASGHVLAQRLAAAATALDSAASYGRWDIMGGGFLATMAKHGKLDEASHHIQASRVSLAQFRKEMSDVQVEAFIEPAQSPLVAFADIVFDGLLVDILVQNRIHQTAARVATTRFQVDRCIEGLVRAAEDNHRQRVEWAAQLEQAIAAG